MSQTCSGRHREVDIVEFSLYYTVDVDLIVYGKNKFKNIIYFILFRAVV